MGRYYNTNNFEGKFGFAVQGSNDPEIFGMEAMEPTSIDYYLEGTDENKAEVRRVIDEQYDIIGIPKDERIYTVDPTDANDDWDKIANSIDKRMWVPYDEKIHGKKIPYALGDETCEMLGWKKDKDGRYPSGIPAGDGFDLASCRIYLGIKILSDLEKDGYCDLNAEI